MPVSICSHFANLISAFPSCFGVRVCVEERIPWSEGHSLLCANTMRCNKNPSNYMM